MIDFKSTYDVIIDDYDEVWIICRSIKKLSNRFYDRNGKLLPNVKHVPELSPSTDLFFKYCELKKRGLWCQKQFDDNYTPIFIEQIENDAEAKKLLANLNELGKQKRIALVCFCKNENMCHRVILKKHYIENQQ